MLGLRRVSNGYAELHFFKDRDGDLPVGEKRGLVFDRERGFRRAPDDELDNEAVLAERLLEFVRENPGLSTVKLTTAVEGRRETLTRILRTDDRFRSERKGNGDYWFEADAEGLFPGDGNTPEHPSRAEGDQRVPRSLITPVGGNAVGTPVPAASPRSSTRCRRAKTASSRRRCSPV